MRIARTLGLGLGLTIAALGLAWAPATSAEETTVRVAYVEDAADARPDAAVWKNVPETKLVLSPQIIIPPVGGGSATEVAVRALHDGDWLAIRLAWADDTPDRAVGVDKFRDAAAVGFPLGESDPPPSPFMGDEAHPIGIWQWTADFEANALGQGDFAERYPHTEGVWYFPQDTSVTREVRAWRGSDPVVEYTAVGWGTLKRRSSTNVLGVGLHDEDGWSVVLRRRLATGAPEDAQFKPGETTVLIVALWDGSKGEVNGRKSVTLGWIPFALETTVEAADAGR